MDSISLNVSRDTMLREVLGMDVIDRDTWKLQNINLLFGKVNNIEYCTTMFHFPTLQDLNKIY